MKKELSRNERQDMEAYVQHSMNIGQLPSFVRNNRTTQPILYRGIQLHQSEFYVGATFLHWEPILSCSTELEVAENFATMSGDIPADAVAEQIRKLGKNPENTDDYQTVYDEYHPVVFFIHGSQGVRLLDYLPDEYEFAWEKEVVILNEPLVVTSISQDQDDFGATYWILNVEVKEQIEKRPA